MHAEIEIDGAANRVRAETTAAAIDRVVHHSTRMLRPMPSKCPFVPGDSTIRSFLPSRKTKGLRWTPFFAPRAGLAEGEDHDIFDAYTPP
jgi:hypothetical protein